MIDLSYSEIQEYLNKLDTSKLPELRISILRNVMVEPIEPYYRYLAGRLGFNARVSFGNYDNVFQEAVGGDSALLGPDTDNVVVFLRLEGLSWELARNFNALSGEQIQAEVERIKEFIAGVLSGIRSQTAAMTLWHSFELPAHPAAGILDSQSGRGQSATIARLNEALRESLKFSGNGYLVDLNLCRLRVGDKDFYDNRYWHIGRAPYSREALREISEEDFKFIRPLKGKNKKCLVLDCDNTLWGGIIGEDGLSGIKLGKTYPGSAYYEFQQEALNLYNRGVILALCSRNDEENVREVFRKHPEMVLREEHIAAARIAWQDKATGIRQLAEDLNIGLDSMVFVDDSEFEIEYVREVLPEVVSIHLPVERAVENRDVLASCGLFDSLSLSEEDKKRGAMYKAEARRKKLRAKAGDLENYLRSLEMVLTVAFADEFSIPRIAQLTQRTNQFNLTTRRYSEEEIKKFSGSGQTDVFSLKLSDRFGDSGIVGAGILRYEPEKAVIDEFLLSCRILGRGVEDAFLIQTLKIAKNKGCRTVLGEYMPTAKNGQVEQFYEKHGFKPLGKAQSGQAKAFSYDLETGLADEPAYFKEIILEAC